MSDKRKGTQIIEVWTDGSCNANHPKKLGGSAVYIKWKDKEYHITKGRSYTTTGRRETEAILLALQAIKKNLNVKATFYIDSQYVANQFRHKFLDWARENLHVENQDLWDAIFSEMLLHRKLRVSVKWIRSHQKDYNDPIVCGNFIADHMANYKNFKEYEKENYLQ